MGQEQTEYLWRHSKGPGEKGSSPPPPLRLFLFWAWQPEWSLPLPTPLISLVAAQSLCHVRLPGDKATPSPGPFFTRWWTREDPSPG